MIIKKLLCLKLNDESYRAVKSGIKTVEARAFSNTKAYDNLQKGDKILFLNEITAERLNVEVIYVKHYPNFENLLKNEGKDSVFSDPAEPLEIGVKRFYAYPEYKERTVRAGVFAIKIKL